MTTAARVCEVCGTDITERRPQARFCSATCRGRHFRGESAPGTGICESCGATLDGYRADARYCGDACRTKARRSNLASSDRATNGFHPLSKARTPASVPAACKRCGSRIGYRDEEGDRWCFMCCRPLVAA